MTVSAVDFRTGYRMDLAALREIVGDRLLIVDGIHGFGAVAEACEAADVLVVGGQKWLRAGWEPGSPCCPTERSTAWSHCCRAGAQDPTVYDDRIHEPADTAARWNITNLSPITSGALARALELVESTGVPAIEAKITERVGLFAEAVRSAGGRP